MQDFAWLDDWLDEIQTENTAEERCEIATVKDHSASIEKSIKSTQNDYNALDMCLEDEPHNGPASGFPNFLNAPILSDTPNVIQPSFDPTPPEERSNNAASIESHSNPDVDKLEGNNHQGLQLL